MSVHLIVLRLICRRFLMRNRMAELVGASFSKLSVVSSMCSIGCPPKAATTPNYSNPDQ
jgi:hypothetical protein